MVLLSFDTEEYDAPREHGVDFSLQEGMDVSIYGTNVILDILQENDVDFLVAKALADQVYSVPSFCEASAAVIDEACKGLLTCEALLHTGVPILAGNAYNQRLLDAAEAHHIPIIKELP